MTQAHSSPVVRDPALPPRPQRPVAIGELRMGGMPQPERSSSSRRFGASVVAVLAAIGAVSAYYVMSGSHPELVTAAPIISQPAQPPAADPAPVPASPAEPRPDSSVAPENQPVKPAEPPKSEESQAAPIKAVAVPPAATPARKRVVPGEAPKMRMAEAPGQAKTATDAAPKELVITKLTPPTPASAPTTPVTEPSSPKVEPPQPVPSEPKPSPAPAPSAAPPSSTAPPSPEPPTSPPPKQPADV